MNKYDKIMLQQMDDNMTYVLDKLGKILGWK